MLEDNEIIHGFQGNRTVIAVPFNCLAFCHLFSAITINSEGRTEKVKKKKRNLCQLFLSSMTFYTMYRKVLKL